jgi:hypothetical protein
MYAEDSDEEASSQNASVVSNKLLSKSADGEPAAKRKLDEIVHYKPSFFEVGVRHSFFISGSNLWALFFAKL